MELAAHSGEVVEEVLVGVKDVESGEHSQVEGSAARGSGLATAARLRPRMPGRPEPHGAAVDCCLAVNRLRQAATKPEMALGRAGFLFFLL
jgi:hypothetical protein